MGGKQTTQRDLAQSAPVPKRKKRRGEVQAKLRSGDRIDDSFTIRGRPLGKGGMGTVYRVLDDAGVEYAIKRLSPALHEEKRIGTRFQREYDQASSLRHPNIIPYQELL